MHSNRIALLPLIAFLPLSYYADAMRVTPGPEAPAEIWRWAMRLRGPNRGCCLGSGRNHERRAPTGREHPRPEYQHHLAGPSVQSVASHSGGVSGTSLPVGLAVGAHIPTPLHRSGSGHLMVMGGCRRGQHATSPAVWSPSWRTGSGSRPERACPHFPTTEVPSRPTIEPRRGGQPRMQRQRRTNRVVGARR
jgi:hypothetical protein